MLNSFMKRLSIKVNNELEKIFKVVDAIINFNTV